MVIIRVAVPFNLQFTDKDKEALFNVAYLKQTTLAL